MKNWMGRYRPLVAQLVKHNNEYARSSTLELEIMPGIKLSAVQWQILEFIVEYEDDRLNMANYAGLLGIPPSTFSKCTKNLVAQGLIGKYQTHKNRKDIILIATKKGKQLYEYHSQVLATTMFNKMFDILSPMSNEDIERITEALKVFDLQANQSYFTESLIKIE